MFTLVVERPQHLTYSYCRLYCSCALNNWTYWKFVSLMSRKDVLQDHIKSVSISEFTLFNDSKHPVVLSQAWSHQFNRPFETFRPRSGNLNKSLQMAMLPPYNRVSVIHWNKTLTLALGAAPTELNRIYILLCRGTASVKHHGTNFTPGMFSIVRLAIFLKEHRLCKISYWFILCLNWRKLHVKDMAPPKVSIEYRRPWLFSHRSIWPQ